MKVLILGHTGQLGMAFKKKSFQILNEIYAEKKYFNKQL